MKLEELFKNQKIKYFLAGVLSTILVQTVIVAVVFILYKNGYFNEKSGIYSGQSVSSLDFTGLDYKINVKNITGIDYKKDILVDKNIYKISFYETQKDIKQIQIDKNILDFMIVKDFFKNNNIALDEFLVSYYVLKGQTFDIKDFIKYLFNIETTNIDMQGFFDYYVKENKKYMDIIQNQDFQTISSYYTQTTEKYTKFINSYKDKNLQTCYYKFCQDEKQVFYYLKSAIINDKKLNPAIKNISKTYDLDPKFFYSILLVENIRMNTTLRGDFKKLLMSVRYPVLPIMSQFSYGVYGTKTKLIDTMVNLYKNPSTAFYIGENKFLDDIVAKYYTKDANGNYRIKNQSGLIDTIVKDKEFQTHLLGVYLYMQIKAWKTVGIDLNNNPGVLMTLYNIGSFKTPHNNPKLGGAYINIGKQTYNFGKLGEIIFFSLELEDIIKTTSGK